MRGTYTQALHSSACLMLKCHFSHLAGFVFTNTAHPKIVYCIRIERIGYSCIRRTTVPSVVPVILRTLRWVFVILWFAKIVAIGVRPNATNVLYLVVVLLLLLLLLCVAFVVGVCLAFRCTQSVHRLIPVQHNRPILFDG